MSDHGHAHGSGCDHGHAHGSGCVQEHGQAEPCHQHECCGHDHKDSAQGSGHDIHGHGHAHEEHRLTEGEAVQQGTPPPDAGDLTARAYDAAEAGEFVQAVALFRQACDLDPAKGRAEDLEALAQCLLETGDAPGAVEAATAALRRRPEWAVAYLTLARAQLNAGAFGAAARSFRDAVALDGSLAEEVREDLETAQRLDIARDEREIVVNGAALRLQQWRGDDGGGDGGGTCAGVEATTRHGTGTMIWECGIVLAGYLMHSLTAEQLRGKRVLELGAGAGVAGLAASALGAHATLTDLEPVTRLLRCNVGLNREALLSAGGSAEVLPLDWNEAAPHGSAAALPEGLAHSGFDLVLGADLVFQPDGQQLPKWMKVVESPRVPEWMSDELRWRYGKAEAEANRPPEVCTPPNHTRLSEPRRVSDAGHVFPRMPTRCCAAAQEANVDDGCWSDFVRGTWDRGTSGFGHYSHLAATGYKGESEPDDRERHGQRRAHSRAEAVSVSSGDR